MDVLSKLKVHLAKTQGLVSNITAIRAALRLALRDQDGK